MRITVTDDEFDAICFAEELIRANIESGADDDFAHDASVHCNCLLNLMKKLRKARAKDCELQVFYKLAQKAFPNENPNIWRKIARKSLSMPE